MAQWVGQQGSEKLGMSSNPSVQLHFLSLLIRWKIVTNPQFLCKKIFDTRIFLKPRSVPYEIAIMCFLRHQIFSIFSSSGILVCSLNVPLLFEHRIFQYRLVSFGNSMQL